MVLKILIFYFLAYNNPAIISTNPLINSQIPVSADQIAFTYDQPIEMSIKNISIYKNITTGRPLLRQTIPGALSKNFRYSEDRKTIFVDILKSTFNEPDENYYVVVEDNAVRNLVTHQPLVGISKGNWMFKTGK